MSNNINFYPDNCPPSDANSHDGYVYLFVRHTPPTRDDTRTAYERDKYPKEDICKRHALSCGKDISYLDRMQQCFPTRKGWNRSKLLLKDCDGVLKQTGNNLLHYSLWLDLSLKLNFYQRLEVI